MKPSRDAFSCAGCDRFVSGTGMPLVEAVKARGVDARVMNGGAMPFDGGFDAVFSNAALHGIRRHDRVTDGAWRVLKKGGRFVAECGGRGHVGGILRGIRRAFACREPDSAALPSLWRFADAPEGSGLNAGFCRGGEGC